MEKNEEWGRRGAKKTRKISKATTCLAAEYSKKCGKANLFRYFDLYDKRRRGGNSPPYLQSLTARVPHMRPVGAAGAPNSRAGTSRTIKYIKAPSSVPLPSLSFAAQPRPQSPLHTHGRPQPRRPQPCARLVPPCPPGLPPARHDLSPGPCLGSLPPGRHGCCPCRRSVIRRRRRRHSCSSSTPTTPAAPAAPAAPAPATSAAATPPPPATAAPAPASTASSTSSAASSAQAQLRPRPRSRHSASRSPSPQSRSRPPKTPPSSPPDPPPLHFPHPPHCLHPCPDPFTPAPQPPTHLSPVHLVLPPNFPPHLPSHLAPHLTPRLAPHLPSHSLCHAPTPNPSPPPQSHLSPPSGRTPCPTSPGRHPRSRPANRHNPTAPRPHIIHRHPQETPPQEESTHGPCKLPLSPRRLRQSFPHAG